MTPRVSIVVPVYNVEPYVRPCLESVLGQTLGEIEVLCVNDGSTDGSRAAVLDLVARDSRVRLVDLPMNQGLSAARNAGVALATGEFLAFVDSDDLVDSRLCERAYAAAQASSADLLIYDFAAFLDGGTPEAARSEPSTLSGTDPGDTKHLLARKAFVWTKLVRTAHFRTLGLEFPVGLMYEDIPVHWQLLTRTARRAILPERLYFYRQRAGAITYGKDLRRADEILVYDQVSAYLDSAGLWSDYGGVLEQQRARAFRVVYESVAPPHRAAVAEMIRHRMPERSWRMVIDPTVAGWRTALFFRALRGDPLAGAALAAWLAARGVWQRRRRRVRAPR